jgi:hypothetical protein
MPRAGDFDRDVEGRVKEIYDAIPGEPINVTIEPKKQ